MARRRGLDSLREFWPAITIPASRSTCCPTLPLAPTAAKNCSIPEIVASNIPSPTARIVARATPSSSTSRTTGPIPRCATSCCARRVAKNTRILQTAVSTPSRMPVRCADRNSTARSKMPSKHFARARSLPSKASEDSSFWSMRAMRRPCARLRQRKHREEKPFALMMPSLEMARQYCEISPAEVALLESQAAPIVLLQPKTGTDIAGNVAHCSPYLGVMLPYSPLHHLLMEECRFPVIATSGNRSDEPIAIANEEAERPPQGHRRPFSDAQPADRARLRRFRRAADSRTCRNSAPRSRLRSARHARGPRACRRCSRSAAILRTRWRSAWARMFFSASTSAISKPSKPAERSRKRLTTCAAFTVSSRRSSPAICIPTTPRPIGRRNPGCR